MIIEFSVKNFRSFKELANLSFEAESLRTDKDILIKTNDKTELLPVLGIFGHNASGKSNLTKALAYMQWAMLNSDYLNQPTTKSPLLQPFQLNSSSRKEPSFFQIVLWDSESKAEYRYGFEINAESVVSEWLELCAIVKKKRSRKMIFQRKGQSFSHLDESIKDSVSHLVNNVRPTALALTVFAQFADPISSQIIKLMQPSNFRIIDGGNGIQNLMLIAMQQYHKSHEFALRVLQLLQRLDLSIQNLKVVKDPPSKLKFEDYFNKPKDSIRAITTHKMYDALEKDGFVEFELTEQESLGTQRLFVLGTILLQVLDLGGIVILDELGASIHPFMSREIIKLFQNRSINPKGAQLVFCSHETYLMSKPVALRQDQIWFTEKNAQEETALRCLVEYNLRSESEFEKNYRQGRFGAVPVIWSE